MYSIYTYIYILHYIQENAFIVMHPLKNRPFLMEMLNYNSINNINKI